ARRPRRVSFWLRPRGANQVVPGLATSVRHARDKVITSRTDFVNHRARLRAKVFDARGFARRSVTFLYGCRSVGRDVHGGRGVDGYGNTPGKAVPVTLPSAHNLSVGRLVRSLYESQVADRSGVHDDALETRLCRIGADARQVFIEPSDKVAHQHQMVTRIHGRIGCIAIPKFPDRGGAFAAHVAPTRVRLLGGDLISDIRAAVVGEHLHEPLAADQPGSDVPLVLLLNLPDQRFGDSLPVLFRNHAEGQRKDAGRLGAIAVSAGRLIEVGLVERNYHAVGKLVKVFRIAFLTKQRRVAG